MEILERGGVDLMLAGHLHHGYTGDARAFYPSTERSILVAQAGTALSLSLRVRDEPNAYNAITLERDRIRIVMKVWKQGEFVDDRRRSCRCENERWVLE